MAEFMFLGLRMTRGISKAEFERQFGSEIDAIYGDVLRKYKSMGLLLEENGRIFLSREGIHVSNSVMADFCRKRLDEQMFLYYTDAMRIAGQRNCAQSMNIITYEKGVTVKIRNSYYL